MPPVRGLRARVRARVRACVRAGFALAALAASPVALFAQTPLTAVGLGYPVAPVDGRSAALGGSGSGLLGGSYSVTNPADLLLHAEPGFSVSLASEGVTLQGDGPSLDTGRGRFTTIRALVPYNDWAFSLAFGGEFDQDWSNILQDTLRLNDGAVPYEETREHNGGISTIDASLARRLGPLGVGISAQRLTGSLRQSFFRQFDDPIGGAPALGGIAGARELSWRAWRFRAGGSIRLGDRVVAGVSLGTGGTLYATPEAAEEPEAEFDLPTSIELGGSVRVADQILVTAGGGRFRVPVPRHCLAGRRGRIRRALPARREVAASGRLAADGAPLQPGRRSARGICLHRRLRLGVPGGTRRIRSRLRERIARRRRGGRVRGELPARHPLLLPPAALSRRWRRRWRRRSSSP